MYSIGWAKGSVLLQLHRQVLGTWWNCAPASQAILQLAGQWELLQTGLCARLASVKCHQVPSYRRLHATQSFEQCRTSCRCIPDVVVQLARWVSARSGVLHERTSACVECASQIHRSSDPFDYQSWNIPHNSANIRNEISHVSIRYASAKNKLISSLYDPIKLTSYIMYVDAKNLYG